MPRPHHNRSPLPAALLAAALALGALTACAGPADDPQAPAGPVAYDVPEIPVRLTAPAGWERLSRDGAFVLRAPAGASTFRANVVVTGEPAAEGLDAAAADTDAAVAKIPGWTADPDGQGATTLGELPAYRLSGTYEVDGSQVAQESVAVEAGTSPEQWVVHLTASWAVDDAEGAAQAHEVLESLELVPAG